MSICGATNVASKALLLLAASSLACGQGYVGSKVCSSCHSEIAKSYALTAMAQASGRATELHLPNGEVSAAKANVTYSVTTKDGDLQLAYRKKMPDGVTVEGAKSLRYYIGSGSHGRGFIFEEGGQPFQAPIAYYGAGRGWDLAPGYSDLTTIFLGRKAESPCLSCHASGPKPVASGLFEEGAVSCERCHGPGEQHVKTPQASKIVNPLKLDAERRDSVCAQCHLTGETRVMKAGRSEATFQPGDLLGEHIVPFVWENPDKAEFKVVGHFEGLWQSKCKRVSGDKLSCLTCHDPHVKVSDADKIAYYRAKCLTCHSTESCKTTLAARKLQSDSCIACHMPQRPSTDGQHTAFTDHSIQRSPGTTTPSERSPKLVAFWKASASDRDSALADADEAWHSGDAAGFEKVHYELLAVLPTASDDATVDAQLAYTEDLAGEPAKAEALYRKALKVDSENLLALTNLGTHLARAGEMEQAVELWKRALAINPGLLPPGLNMARVQWRLGQLASARETLRRVLSLNPDSQPALDLMKEMEKQP